MKQLYTLLVICLALTLSACSTPMSVSLDQQENARIPSNPNKAQIYFYRDKAFQGVLRGIYVTVDGTRVGGLNSGTYFVHEVSPGTHAFSVEDWLGDDPSRHMTVRAGEKRYLKGSLQMGFWDAQPKLEIVANEEGQAAIKELAYGKLKEGPQNTKPAN